MKSTKITLKTSIYNFWNNYVQFRGTSTRMELWYSLLFAFIVAFLVHIIFVNWLGTIINTIVLIPLISLHVRRFHDVGISGFWYLLPAMLLMGSFAVCEGIWLQYLIAEIIPVGMQLWVGCALLWVIFVLIVDLLPSKTIKNKYRKK